MPRNRQKSSMCTKTILLVLTLTALLANNAIAQQAVVDRCREASSDADRIACLEAALLAQEPQAAVVGIGAGQVIARTQTREEMLASLETAEGLRVVSYDIVPFRRLVVTLENGQVWRQIKGDTQHIRVDLKRNQTVNINESSVGGYKLRLNEMRRAVRVERIL